LATIKDVAQRAGVAISTVSAVINRSAPASEDTILRVEQAVKDIGYTPHGGAQSLRNGRSRFVGLVVPNIANPHFAAVAREVENACFAAGYTSVVYSTGQDPERESQVLAMMRAQRVAGLVVIPTRSDAEHGRRLIHQIHVPTILLDMYVEGLPFDVVKTDNVEAGHLAADHLLALGHRRIGIVVGIPGLATSDDRYAGFAKAHREFGLLVDPRMVVRGDFEQHRAYASAISLLTGDDRPIAVVAISNMMTLGVLFAIKAAGLKVPREISLIGIDDLEFADLIDPPLTAVVTPILPMARRSIELLLRQLDGGSMATGIREVQQPQLVVRGSAASIGLQVAS
jgi:DNA-binding LacI/PurR family transcriptional regulator